MTREDYLLIRHNPVLVAYTFYRERFSQEKHKYMLPLEQFEGLFLAWHNGIPLMSLMIAHYDTEFNIMLIRKTPLEPPFKWY